MLMIVVQVVMTVIEIAVTIMSVSMIMTMRVSSRRISMEDFENYKS